MAGDDDADAGGAAGDDASELWQCSEHPYRTQPNPGGICALCLQEKLGQLVTSSKSSSPFAGAGVVISSKDSLAHSPPTTSSSSSSSFAPPAHQRPARSRFPPFHYPSYSYQRGKKILQRQQRPPVAPFDHLASSRETLMRSKSVAPRPINEEAAPPAPLPVESPRKKSFWSFLHHLNGGGSSGHGSGNNVDDATSVVSLSARRRSVSVTNGGHEEFPGSPSQASSSSFGRKVARSRSVGCGSRSFSGDFLERISSGFGDCTLRRVESQREPKPRTAALGPRSIDVLTDDEEDDDGEAEARRSTVKCAGFFGAPSAPSYWMSAAIGEGSSHAGAPPPRMSTSVNSSSRGHRGWGWAFASPIRALRPLSSSRSTLGAPPAANHSGEASVPAN